MCCTTAVRDTVFQTVADTLGIPISHVHEKLPLGDSADDVVMSLGSRGFLKRQDTADPLWEVKDVLALTT
jgi:hypothetical protein